MYKSLELEVYEQKKYYAIMWNTCDGTFFN